MNNPSTPPESVSAHHAVIDTTRTKAYRILQIVANPTISTSTGWRLGFWGAELTHPYYEFTEAGYEVTIASPGPVDHEVKDLAERAARYNRRATCLRKDASKRSA